jgi:hypothetical protein
MEAAKEEKDGEKEGEEKEKTEEEKAEESKDEEKAEEEKKESEETSPSGKNDPKSRRNKELWQRVNNWKLAVRLNSEILSQQNKMKDMLRSNKYLIPEVSTQQKTDAFILVKEYCAKAREFIEANTHADMTEQDAKEFLASFEQENPIALGVVSAPQLAISTNVGVRVVKLAALLDNSLLLRHLEEDVNAPLVLSRVPKLAEWGREMLKHFQELVL